MITIIIIIIISMIVYTYMYVCIHTTIIYTLIILYKFAHPQGDGPLALGRRAPDPEGRRRAAIIFIIILICLLPSSFYHYLFIIILFIYLSLVIQIIKFLFLSNSWLFSFHFK